ncbi:MAG: glycerol-3-phosphate acyltransferase [Mogibacterium sp.]|nr:glycerol-3-phosphate acyltransferase [Mogibacterium sp.]
MTLDYTNLAIIGAIAYAIGNISPSIIIGKIYGVDIRKEGSGNAGTTNTIRVIGLTAGLICLFVDVLKGFVAVTVGYNMGDVMGSMVAFACVILGHCFPVIWKFKGGKGVASAFGAALALNWPSAIAAFVVALVLLILTRRMSVGSIGALLVYPALIWYYYPECFYFSIGAAAFLILMHISNIIRLSKGEEKQLTFGQRTLRDRKKPVEDNNNVVASEPEAGQTYTEIGVADKPLTEEELRELGADAQVVEDIESGESPIAADATREPSLIGAQTQDAIRPAPEPIDYYADTVIPDLGEKACKIAVIGNGSFGTAMANLLVYNGHDVTLYGRNAMAMELLQERRINDHYLPYVILSDRIKYTSDLKEAVTGKSIVVFAVPTQQFREVSSACAEFLEDGVIAVNLAKGIEQVSLKRLSQIAAETIPDATYVALSGPSHAEEVVRNFPAGVVVCSKDKEAAEHIQDVFMSEKFRVYTQDDMIGVETCGAVKNVIAIATGIADGMKLGSNARAVLMTRAIHEIKRLGTAAGANPETFSGLSGIGDLIVTCSTNLSRNRRCGLLIGLGLEPEEAVKRVGSVVEGYYTAEAICEVAEMNGIEMPICRATNLILKGRLAPEKAIKQLMSRSKKDELI